MNPNQHRGRLIKETSLIVNSKHMDTHRNQSLPQIALNHLTESKKNGISNISPDFLSADGTSLLILEKLKQRIKELESENARMKTQVNQSEQSIISYRTFIAGLEIPKVTIATQTETALICKTSKDNAQTDSKLLKMNKMYDELLCKYNSQDNSNTEQINSLKIEIEKLKMSHSLFKNSKDQEKVQSKNETLLKIDSLSKKVSELKISHKLIRSTVTSQLNSHGSYFDECCTKLKKIIDSKDQNQKLNIKISNLKSSLESENKKCIELHKNLADAQQVIEKLNNQINSSEKTISMKSQSCDPLSPMASRLTKQNEAEMKISKLEAQLKIALECTEENQKMKCIFSSNLMKASSQLEELQKSHENEINTTKHLAHVKDLGRIATIREVFISIFKK
jgi:chromosome segregation ATPase